MKTKKIRIKQGFTIVELVIVIGVIGVLAAVLIPTFVNLNNKAQEAENQSFVKNLNTQMAIRETEEGKNKTMYDAIKDAKEIGFDVEKLTPVNGRDLVWDSVANRFALLNEDGSAFYSDGGLKGTGEQIWKIYDAMPGTQTYSIYAKSGWSAKDVVVTVGFDAGSNVMSSVKYTGTKDVTIRTNGDHCKFTVDAPSANVDFYGFAQEIEVAQVKGQSLHIYGSADKLAVAKGHVAIESTGIIFTVTALDTVNGSITNGGYIAEVGIADPAQKAAVETAINGGSSSKKIGGDYEINTVGNLESLRDSVNAGKNFSGITVKLMKDLTLTGGWTPIGRGGRKNLGDSANPFSGTFDGNHKTITGLTNKGFEPGAADIYADNGNSAYAYGLFGLVKDATLKDLTLDKVSIAIDNTQGDSVGGLVGYAQGNLTVSGVTVNGSVLATDSVAGVIGRVYSGGTVNVSGCVNNASVTVEQAIDSTKCAGVVGYVTSSGTSGNFIFSGNKNTGKITALKRAAGIVEFGGLKENDATNVTFTNNINEGDIAVKNMSCVASIACNPSHKVKGTITESGNTNTGTITVDGEAYSAKLVVNDYR